MPKAPAIPSTRRSHSIPRKAPVPLLSLQWEKGGKGVWRQIRWQRWAMEKTGLATKPLAPKPMVGIEPTTSALRKLCSTVELLWLKILFYYGWFCLLCQPIFHTGPNVKSGDFFFLPLTLYSPPFTLYSLLSTLNRVAQLSDARDFYCNGIVLLQYAPWLTGPADPLWRTRQYHRTRQKGCILREETY